MPLFTESRTALFPVSNQLSVSKPEQSRRNSKQQLQHSLAAQLLPLAFRHNADSRRRRHRNAASALRLVNGGIKQLQHLLQYSNAVFAVQRWRDFPCTLLPPVASQQRPRFCAVRAKIANECLSRKNNP
jgi:hypothetical protein